MTSPQAVYNQVTEYKYFRVKADKLESCKLYTMTLSDV